jgi:hypothetical protein
VPELGADGRMQLLESDLQLRHDGVCLRGARDDVGLLSTDADGMPVAAAAKRQRLLLRAVSAGPVRHRLRIGNRNLLHVLVVALGVHARLLMMRCRFACRKPAGKAR